MPTRYLKPGVCDSESINKLIPLAEVMFYRLLVCVDDFGRLDARPLVLKAKCFPIKEEVTAETIETLLSKLSKAGLILVYEVAGNRYLQMLKWDNIPRAKESKFPQPNDSAYNCMQTYADDEQLHTNLPVTGTETGTVSTVSHDKIVFDGSSFQNVNGQLAIWQKAYPAIDIQVELNKAAAWIVANPKNAKSNYARFLTNWLSRAQDKAPKVATTSSKFRGE